MLESYEQLLRYVLNNGTPRGDRTGTGTISVFAPPPVTYRSISETFPLVTTKKIHWKSVVHELLWFLSGETNIKYLRDNKVKIWDEWADEDGGLGPVYGKQWRNWFNNCCCGEIAPGTDQIADVIESIKTNPESRRHIVSAWNVSDLPEMALVPCHVMFQFYVRGKYLDCQMYQRSADMFLGVPFNIASYALLTMMIAHVCGLEAGNLTHVIGDAHIYSNHIEQVKLQLSRDVRRSPKVGLSPGINDIDEFTYGDIVLLDYNPHGRIRAPVAV